MTFPEPRTRLEEGHARVPHPFRAVQTLKGGSRASRGIKQAEKKGAAVLRTAATGATGKPCGGRGLKSSFEDRRTYNRKARRCERGCSFEQHGCL